jgi:hypothetical protein
LQERRDSELVSFEALGLKFTASISRYPSGESGEMFLDPAKPGSTINTLVRYGDRVQLRHPARRPAGGYFARALVLSPSALSLNAQHRDLIVKQPLCRHFPYRFCREALVDLPPARFAVIIALDPLTGFAEWVVAALLRRTPGWSAVKTIAIRTKHAKRRISRFSE